MRCMTKVNWQDQFKSAIQNAENLYSKDSTDVSLLMFCLRSKLIPSAEYLNWAKENFQIPVLSEKFFQVHKPNQELYKKWQKVYKWTNECLPVAEWDGVLIIACLEIPESYSHVNPTTFVLTSHEVLDQTWVVYNKSQKTASAASAGDFTDMTALAATVVASPGANNFLDANGDLILQNDESSHDEEISEESSSEEGEESSAEESAGESPDGMELAIDEEAAGMPEGLFGDSPAPKMESLTSLTKTEPIALQPMNTEVTKEMHIAIEDEVKNPAASAGPKKGPRTSEPLMATLGEKTKIDDISSLDNLEEVQDHEVQFPNKKQISPMTSASPGDYPSAPVKPTMNHGNTAAYFLEKIRKQGQDHFDKEVIATFQHMKTFFKKSMLLAIGDKDRLLKPILWDGSFDVQKPATAEYNLKTPSVFKVVSGTQKPYHGYIVPNDLNESFFESWNHGQIPDHVTIVPLMDGDHVVGMIMGFGEKASYNKNVLSFTESVAKGLSSKILKGPMAKVA